MSVDTRAFLERWHEIVAKRDLAALAEVLADDVTLGAPPYWNRFGERDIVVHLLGLIVNTIEGFTYRREWVDGRELALEFTGQVDGLDLQGIDLITLNERGLVQSLDVPMRPMNTVSALRDRIAPQMTAFLKERAERAAAS